MCIRGSRRMMPTCQSEALGPGITGPRQSQHLRRPTMTTLKLTARYARYLLTSLASVAFGLTGN